jgi:RecJ-like exonuclease
MEKVAYVLHNSDCFRSSIYHSDKKGNKKMSSHNLNEKMEDCPECRGTGKISAVNCSACGGSGEIIIHSHMHSHGDNTHDHPHPHDEPHHPKDDTSHKHKHG